MSLDPSRHEVRFIFDRDEASSRSCHVACAPKATRGVDGGAKNGPAS